MEKESIHNADQMEKNKAIIDIRGLEINDVQAASCIMQMVEVQGYSMDVLVELEKEVDDKVSQLETELEALTAERNRRIIMLSNLPTEACTIMLALNMFVDKRFNFKSTLIVDPISKLSEEEAFLRRGLIDMKTLGIAKLSGSLSPFDGSPYSILSAEIINPEIVQTYLEKDATDAKPLGDYVSIMVDMNDALQE